MKIIREDFEGIQPIENYQSSQSFLLNFTENFCTAWDKTVWVGHVSAPAGGEKFEKIIVIHQVWEEIKVGRWDIIGNVITEQTRGGKKLKGGGEVSYVKETRQSRIMLS